MLLGDLAYPDLAGRTRAVHLLPLGATEPHGPHAPLSTDTLISAGICERAAERLRGDVDVLVLPPLSYGVTRYGAAFPGAVGISEETLARIVAEIAEGLERLVLVNSHFEPEQVETLRATGVPLLDLTRRANAERLTEEFRLGSCHAGRYETSLVLADRPELVHRERMAALPARIVDMPGAIAEGRNDFLSMGMHEAYCGSPAEATPEEGAQTFETLAELLVELVR
ncbi:MAG TPA: creatininase family protein, partial [Gaiellaceae bacterium]|nr:creatininase family protein [Gaiellaceae bacterium]